MSVQEQTRPAQPRQRIHWTPATAMARMDDIEQDMDGVLDALEAADLDWTKKLVAADLAEDKSYLNAAGSIEYRRRWARVETADLRWQAELAAVVMRNLKARLRALESKADTARSRNAAVRADAGLAMSGRRP